MTRSLLQLEYQRLGSGEVELDGSSGMPLFKDLADVLERLGEGSGCIHREGALLGRGGYHESRHKRRRENQLFEPGSHCLSLCR